MNVNTVLFIGKPGSGKGTQAKLLSEKTGWQIISSGDLFRAIAREDNEVGRRIKVENDQGLLQPDWFAMYLFQKTILPIPQAEGILFDGFGRKVPEAQNVVNVLTWLERPFVAIHVKVSDEEIVNRLTKRAQASGRADDKAIEKRLEEYRIYTEPSIEVFKNANALIEVNGEGAVEDIHADIWAKLANA